jgi:hypothetical protein
MYPEDIRKMMFRMGYWYTYWYLTEKNYYSHKRALWLMWVGFWTTWTD